MQPRRIEIANDAAYVALGTGTIRSGSTINPT